MTECVVYRAEYFQWCMSCGVNGHRPWNVPSWQALHMQVGTFYVGGLPINLTDFLNVDGLTGIGNIPYNLFYITGYGWHFYQTAWTMTLPYPKSSIFINYYILCYSFYVCRLEGKVKCRCFTQNYMMQHFFIIWLLWLWSWSSYYILGNLLFIWTQCTVNFVKIVWIF